MTSRLFAQRFLELRPRLILAATTIAPALVALTSLSLWLWVTALSVREPLPGLYWSTFDPGRVLAVDKNGPAYQVFHPHEDRILSVDGLAQSAFPLPADRHWPGATVTFEVADVNGEVRLVDFTFPSQTSSKVLVERYVLLFVDLVFWLCSLMVIPNADRFNTGRRTILYFFATLQLVVFYTLLTALGWHRGEPWNGLAAVSALWLSVLAVHFHFRFPLERRLPRPGQWALGAAYVCVGLLSLIRLFGPTRELRFFLWGIQNEFVVVALGSILIIGIANLAAKTSGLTRFRIRLISLASLVGFAPMLFFTALPYAAIAQPSSQFTYTFLFIAAVPVGYTYAILRYQLTRSDGVSSRVFGYVITILAMAIVLAIGFAALAAFGLTPDALYFLMAAIGLAFAFEPLRRRSQRLAERLFYQPWDEYRTTLSGVHEVLSSAPDISVWARTLCSQFAQSLRVRHVGLLYRVSQNAAFRLVEHDPLANAQRLDADLPVASPVIAALAAAATPLSARDLRDALIGTPVPASTRAWLADVAYDLWWPIVSRGGLQAVLLFGPRSGEFQPDEIELIALSARQIGVALENAQFARELEQLSRSAMQTRDDERRRVSRELHDHIIQPLVGLNFALSAAREAPAAAEARLQVADLIGQVRRISAELRPPALDAVGLPAAARGLTRTFARTTGMQVDFGVAPDEDLDIPEPLASAFFGALREALANVEHHAHATQVSVQLEVRTGVLSLVVQDDGSGFTLPARLGQLALAGHFGLLGLQERMAALGGTLEVNTQPGQGTRVACRAPFPPPSM